jgi:hypothetical protein
MEPADVPMIEEDVTMIEDEDIFMDGMYTDPPIPDENMEQDVNMDPIMPEASSSKRTRSQSLSTTLQSPRMANCTLLTVK